MLALLMNKSLSLINVMKLRYLPFMLGTCMLDL